MNESLLPTRTTLQGGEVLRIVGTDGKPLRVPLSALLDAAEQRFATRSGEATKIQGLWAAVNDQAARLAALEKAAAPVDLNPLRDDVAVLTARVLVLESQVQGLLAEIKTKKDK